MNYFTIEKYGKFIFFSNINSKKAILAKYKVKRKKDVRNVTRYRYYTVLFDKSIPGPFYL